MKYRQRQYIIYLSIIYVNEVVCLVEFHFLLDSVNQAIKRIAHDGEVRGT